jgi:hypothetical protein
MKPKDSTTGWIGQKTAPTDLLLLGKTAVLHYADASCAVVCKAAVMHCRYAYVRAAAQLDMCPVLRCSDAYVCSFLEQM